VDGTEFSTALPLQLLYFRADKADENVELDWETQDEKNVAGYFVEYSTDGREFTAISWVDSKGNYSGRQRYNFLHTEPKVGFNFYRLVLEDLDSNTKQSDIRSVYFAKKTVSSAMIYPNPTTIGQDTYLSLALETAQQIDIEVYDAHGRQIQKLQTERSAGDHNLPLADSAFAPGIYFINVKYAQRSETLKLVVTK